MIGDCEAGGGVRYRLGAAAPGARTHPGLLANIARLAGSSDLALARRHWLDLFERQDDMFALANRLRARYRVYLLSNVGDLHWTHLREHYRLRDLADDALPSFEAGVMKPHAGIYQQAERRFALDPAHSVFIDDRTDNVDAVRQRGWHGIVHRTAATTIAELENLGYLTH